MFRARSPRLASPRFERGGTGGHRRRNYRGYRHNGARCIHSAADPPPSAILLIAKNLGLAIFSNSRIRISDFSLPLCKDRISGQTIGPNIRAIHLRLRPPPLLHISLSYRVRTIPLENRVYLLLLSSFHEEERKREREERLSNFSFSFSLPKLDLFIRYSYCIYYRIREFPSISGNPTVATIFTGGYKFGQKRLTKWSVRMTRLMAERGGYRIVAGGEGGEAFRNGIAANKRETLFH